MDAHPCAVGCDPSGTCPNVLDSDKLNLPFGSGRGLR